MRNRQNLQNRKRLIKIYEDILIENGDLFNGEVQDSREGFREQVFRVDRRRKNYFDRIKEMANEIRPVKQISNSIEPDFDSWLPNMTDALFELRGLDVNLRWENINLDMKVPESRNQIKMFLRNTPFLPGSDLTAFEVYRRDNNEAYPPAVEVYIINDVERFRLQQSFREGISHCMFEPIKKWTEEMIENSNSASTIKKYKAMYNKAVKFEKKYDKGVPQEDILDICNSLQIGLDITLPFSKDSFISYKSGIKPRKTFKFINTRLNHIDLGNVVGKNDTITLSKDKIVFMTDPKDDILKSYEQNTSRILQPKAGLITENTVPKL